MIRLPDEFRSIERWFATEHQRLRISRRYQLGRGVPSSIDDLQPDAPHLLAYRDTPIRPGLPYHNIIGTAAGDSDGVVPVESARIENATSELRIDAHHDANADPIAIREVRRILLLHLAED